MPILQRQNKQHRAQQTQADNQTENGQNLSKYLFKDHLQIYSYQQMLYINRYNKKDA